MLTGTCARVYWVPSTFFSGRRSARRRARRPCLRARRRRVLGAPLLRVGAGVGWPPCAPPVLAGKAAPSGSVRAPAPLTASPEFGGWMLAPDGPAGSDVRTAPDGSRLFVSRGTRWVD